MNDERKKETEVSPRGLLCLEGERLVKLTFHSSFSPSSLVILDLSSCWMTSVEASSLSSSSSSSLDEAWKSSGEKEANEKKEGADLRMSSSSSLSFSPFPPARK